MTNKKTDDKSTTNPENVFPINPETKKPFTPEEIKAMSIENGKKVTEGIALLKSVFKTNIVVLSDMGIIFALGDGFHLAGMTKLAMDEFTESANAEIVRNGWKSGNLKRVKREPGDKTEEVKKMLAEIDKEIDKKDKN